MGGGKVRGSGRLDTSMSVILQSGFVFKALVEAPVVRVCACVEDGLDVRDDVRAWAG